MNPAALLACLLAPAVAPFALAETPAAPAAPAQQAGAAAPLPARLRALLDGQESANRTDVEDAAILVLAETGDPLAFRPLMEEASRAGSAVATLWLAPLELNRLSVLGAELETSPRAAELRARVFAAVGKGYRPAFALASNMAGMGIGAPADKAAATRYLMEGSKAGCQQSRAAYLLLSERLQKGGITDPAVAAELGRNNFYLEEMIAQAALDEDESLKWLRRASEHGSALAPYLLAQSGSASLAEGEALKYLQLAVSRHHVGAMALLGNLWLQASGAGESSGNKLSQNHEGGLKLLRLAATLGEPEAAQALATAMAQRQAGAATAEQICSLYRLAAEQGEPQGMAGYGYCLMTGRGCTADTALGEKLLQSALDKGVPWVNQARASMYFNGDGVKPDMRRAVSSLGEDAAMGSVHAYAIMAALAALGNEGTPPDAFRARIYLDMAKEDGDAGAQALYDAIIAARGWRFLPGLW